MIDKLDLEHLADEISLISIEAGNAIMEIYANDIDHELKSDNSPLTKADLESHRIITSKLSNLIPSIPILSEEAEVPYKLRSSWERYWLIDPLDGTKEFLKKNGEFTVNIALIENHLPKLGLIYVPSSKTSYVGYKGGGSYTFTGNKSATKINVTHKKDGDITIVSSRSHPSKELDRYLSNFEKMRKISVGSSLKFCLIAEGKADLYPRFGPTSEWDTAAGQAILVNAGGSVIHMNGSPLRYNEKQSLLNQNFLAISSNQSKDIKKYLDSFT